MYSAIQQDGRRLYDLARAGQEVERAPRPVMIERLDLLAWEPPCADLVVVCSPGTYIRSLAFDLGRTVGVGAHLAALERSASGSFTVADAVSWTDLEAAMAAGTWRDWLLPPERAVAHLPAVELDADAAQLVRNGVRVEAAEAQGLARGVDADGRLVAVLEGQGLAWKPHKVFNV